MRKIDHIKNMRRANILAENRYMEQKQQDEKNPQEINKKFLSYDTLPDCVKSNVKNSITVSVAFVKKDGTVRHMAFRDSLKSYKKSEAEKTEAQKNYLSANNLMNVYDTNIYIKTKRENIQNGMSPEDAAADASKKSFRNFKLENVLGFVCNGKFYDMREKNNIVERFGFDIAQKLTKGMEKAMEAEEKISNIEMEKEKMQ